MDGETLVISIHALREEGDHVAPCGDLPLDDFYPRPPRGGRRGLYHEEETLYRFLSTPSARRATSKNIASRNCSVISIHALREEGNPGAMARRVCPARISIHALREEGDKLGGCIMRKQSVFLSTPSARRATEQNAAVLSRVDISIHALREEGDNITNDRKCKNQRFLSTPSARRATVL